MSNSSTVTAFVAAWNRKDLEAIMAAFAEDAVYHNIPMDPTKGKPAIRAYIEKALARYDAVDWITHHQAESPDGTVLNERSDDFIFNGRRISVPVMGVFEFRGGRISAWRDYFDLGQFQRQLQG
jgi:limonene-1,2-epoxide hydrolase